MIRRAKRIYIAPKGRCVLMGWLVGIAMSRLDGHRDTLQMDHCGGETRDAPSLHPPTV